MGCGCGGNKARRNAGAVYTYGLTAPGGGEEKTYLTMLEVRKEMRRMGGGTVRRIVDRSSAAQPAASVAAS
jgi:hypothetical protein